MVISVLYPKKGGLRPIQTKGKRMSRRNKTYGYARVSAKDQNLARQLDALHEFPVQESMIYTDKASGKDFQRPAYQELMRTMRPGDVLVVKSIDRLGRSYDEILEEWRRITKTMECAVVVIDMPLLDTRTTRSNVTGVFISDIVLQLLSYVAQVERDNIRQRQAEGIAAAQARGVRFGRPPKKRPKCYDSTKQAFTSGNITRKEAAARLRVSVTTFEKWMREDEAGSKAPDRAERIFA